MADQDNNPVFDGDISKYEQYLNMLKGTTPNVSEPVQSPTSDASDSTDSSDSDSSADDDSDEEDDTDPTLASNEKPSSPSQPTLPQTITGDDHQINIDVSNAKPTLGTVDNLIKAQAVQNDTIFRNQLLKGLDRLGAGIARTQPVAQQDYDQNIKLSGLPVEQFQAITAQEKGDPGSALSQGLKGFLKDQFGINVQGDISANDIEKIAPWAVKTYEMKQGKNVALATAKQKADEEIRHNKAMEDLAGEKLDTATDTSDEKKQEKQDKENTQRFDKMGKLITAELASSRSTMGIDAKTLQGADSLKALAAGTKDLNDLDIRQAYEAARVLDRMLSQGAPTDASSGKLTPETGKSWLKKKWEYVTNTRQGADLGSFLKNTMDTADREASVAKQRIQNAQGKLLAPYSDLADKDPDKWALIMKQHDLPEDLFDNKPVPQSMIDHVTKEQVPKSLPSGQFHIQADHAKSNDLVTIRRKSDGKTKAVSADQAQQYLADPGYEQVQ